MIAQIGVVCKNFDGLSGKNRYKFFQFTLEHRWKVCNNIRGVVHRCPGFRRRFEDAAEAGKQTKELPRNSFLCESASAQTQNANG